VVYLGCFVLLALLADLLPLPYGPAELDLEHLFQRPFKWALYHQQQPFHWLGTDQLGRDVLSNLIFGCRTALLVSLPAMGLAVSIGLLLGGTAGYFGDRALRVSRASWVALPVVFFLAWFYAFYLRQISLQESFDQRALSGIGELARSLLLFVSISLLLYPLKQGLKRWKPLRTSTFFPADTIVLKLMELLASVPNLVLILALASLIKPSLLLLICITGLTFWPEPARLIRAEVLSIRNQAYIETTRALGAGHWYILLRHALPNAISPVLIAFAFGIARLMALESTLSFLGFGVPPDTPSWGRLVNGMKDNHEAWWLVLLPGMVLCLTVLAVHRVSAHLAAQRESRI
jgi:peptide/nickel transport system permease protein